MTGNPRCRTCGKPIYGVPLEATRYGRGWLHQNNRETCSAPHRAVAEPFTIPPTDDRYNRVRTGGLAPALDAEPVEGVQQCRTVSKVQRPSA